MPIKLTSCLTVLAVALGACKGEGDGQGRARLDAPSVKPQAEPLIPPGCPVFPIEQTCPQTTCGGNSPEVNGFPINGVHVGAENCPNPGQVRLTARSLRRGRSRCPDASRLGHDGNGGLVGKSDSSEVVCKGDELIGATIELERTTNGTTMQATLMIAEMKTVEQSELDDKPATKRPAYRFVDVAAPHRGLCDDDSQLTWRAPLVTAMPPTAMSRFSKSKGANSTPPRKPSLAIVVPGMLFSSKLEEYELKSPETWINFACSDHALGKMVLARMVEGALAKIDATPSEKRISSLKMVTAKYCDDVSHTIQGVDVKWAPAPGWADVDEGWVPEARWNAHGATCLSRARLAEFLDQVPAGEVPGPCGKSPVPCDETTYVKHVGRTCPEGRYAKGKSHLPTCEELPPQKSDIWTTYVVDYQ